MGSRASDITLNWVGLDHVGALVFLAAMPVDLGCPQIHAPTRMVMDDPLLLLEWLDRYRVSISWAPNFLYALLNERVERLARGGWTCRLCGSLPTRARRS